MIGGLHVIDLLPVLVVPAFVVGLAIVIARNIGAGYARARHELEHHDTQRQQQP